MGALERLLGMAALQKATSFSKNFPFSVCAGFAVTRRKTTFSSFHGVGHPKLLRNANFAARRATLS